MVSIGVVLMCHGFNACSLLWIIGCYWVLLPLVILSTQQFFLVWVWMLLMFGNTLNCLLVWVCVLLMICYTHHFSLVWVCGLLLL